MFVANAQETKRLGEGGKAGIPDRDGGPNAIADSTAETQKAPRCYLYDGFGPMRGVRSRSKVAQRVGATGTGHTAA